MQLKLRHIILYVGACIVLGVAEVSGLSLLAILSLLQLAVLLQSMPFTRQAQLAELKLFLISLPSIFFWGAMHSFTHIYLKESSPVLGLMAMMVTLCITLIVGFMLVFSQDYLEKNNFAVLNALSDAFNDIRKEKKRLFKTAFLLFILSFPPLLAVDWKIVFSLTATLFWLNRSQLKKAFSHPS
ncbi:MAG: hypothetical protein K0R29_2466 [Pseudobdellovibrio sp.]|jgi:hypothetical protein|nr:hypothetical protein [Pseudobdellovibrio sp.]